MAIRSYYLNARVRLGNHSSNTDTGPFTTAAGVVTDPSTVAITVQEPDGTETTYTYALAEVTKETTGRYYIDIDLDAPGLWSYRMSGAGAVVATMEHQLHVKASVIE